MATMICLLQFVLIGLLATAYAVPLAPSKDWCKASSSKKQYALFPSGKCAKCDFTVFTGNHCNDFIGEICPDGPAYNIVTKGAYRYCVCGKSWYGSPIGDKAGATVSFGGSQDAGCALCPIFGTTSAPNATTAKQCTGCRKSLLFTGAGPFCQWNPTAFVNASCEIPNWITNPAKIKINGKCACKANHYGTWPDCRPCPDGLTAAAGNGRVCTCDPKQGYVAKSAKKPAACTCNTAKGYYPMLPNRNTTKCVLCSSLVGTAVVTTKDGVKRCGCNTRKGYGINIGAKGPICLKCSTVGAKVDPKTGGCRCTRGGYGVEAGYDPTDADYKTYCVSCQATGGKVNSKGFCSCKPGFARTRFVSGRICIPCSGPHKRPVLQPLTYPQPICGCEKGYEGAIYSATDKCTKCGKGQDADPTKVDAFGFGYREFCTCKDPHASYTGPAGCNACEDGYVFSKKAGRCVQGAACKASKWTARIWGSSALPKSWNGTFFPSELLDKNVKPTKTITLSSLSVTFPDSKIKVGSRFVVVLDAVLWGKKVAPYWLGAGVKRFLPQARLIATSANSKVALDQGNFLTSTNPNYGTPQEYRSFNLDMSQESCKTVRLGWWGNKSGARLKLRLLRNQSPVGAAWP